MSFNSGGWAGAFEAGYDLQRGNLVLGVVAGLGYMDISGREQDGTNRRSTRTDTYMSTDSGPYGSAAVRFGVAVDDFLFYGKAGGAVFFGGSSVDDSCSDGPGCGPGRVHASGDDSRLGWTIGGGAQYRINDAWSLKLDYAYYDFGDETLEGTAEFVFQDVTNAARERWTNSLTAQTALAGFSYCS